MIDLDIATDDDALQGVPLFDLFPIDANTIRATLSAVCTKAVLVGETAASDVPWPGARDALLLAWPGPDQGIAIALRRSPAGADLLDAMPMIDAGDEVEAELVGLILSEDAVQGAARVNVGPVELCYTDPHFPVDRLRYTTAGRCRVRLLGLATELYEADDTPLVIPPQAGGFDALRAAGVPMAEDGNLRLPGRGVAALLPMGEGRPQDYLFVGPVRRVAALPTPVLGAQITLITIAIGPVSEGVELSLTIAATRATLEGFVPQVGDHVTGAVMMQGRLIRGADEGPR